MTTANSRAFRLHACLTCGGDAYLDTWDDPEWRCLQCGRLVPTKEPATITNTRRDTLKAA